MLRVWTIQEHCIAQLLRVSAGVLPADPVMDVKTLCALRSYGAHDCKQWHEPWKQLCSNMGPALDDNDMCYMSTSSFDSNPQQNRLLSTHSHYTLFTQTTLQRTSATPVGEKSP